MNADNFLKESTQLVAW